MPVALPAESEACALGSALVAAVHTGRYPDLNTAAKNMVRIAEVVEPRAETRAAYEAGYGRYKATYAALRELMHQAADG
jgi:sugar (pentulose or hexulose) kinase